MHDSPDRLWQETGDIHLTGALWRADDDCVVMLVGYVLNKILAELIWINAVWAYHFAIGPLRLPLRVIYFIGRPSAVTDPSQLDSVWN
jgi:hypothetical protein